MRARQPRVRDRDYLGFIAGSCCIACLVKDGKIYRPVQVAHLRSGSLEHGKRPTGGAEKPGDIWSSGICFKHHNGGPDSQHARGDELAWWEELGVDPFQLCVDLQAAFDDGRSPDTVVIRHAGAARRAKMEQSA